MVTAVAIAVIVYIAVIVSWMAVRLLQRWQCGDRCGSIAVLVSGMAMRLLI